jgi:hypothetical protein
MRQAVVFVGFLIASNLLSSLFAEGSKPGSQGNPDSTLQAATSSSSSTWASDYSAAYHRAVVEKKMVLLWFVNDQPTTCDFAFWRNVLLNPKIAEKLAEKYICVQVNLSTRLNFGQGEFTISNHPSFAHMLHQSGIAVVDLTDAASAHYGKVVSAFPAGCGRPLDLTKTQVVLNLPAGSLTQRTLVYAVRMHGEAPQSTTGAACPLLMNEATKHSSHQASIRLQGHHGWNQRFQSISAQLGGGMHAQEVCAESWPGQNLVEAAEELVNSWRQSSGHWSAVRAGQPRYGYDMKLGSNGVWYGTGIFGQF